MGSGRVWRSDGMVVGYNVFPGPDQLLISNINSSGFTASIFPFMVLGKLFPISEASNEKEFSP